MADEVKLDDNQVTATAPAEVAAPKKRGPRAKKVDAATAESSPAPSAGKGRKRKETSAEAKTASQPKRAARANAARKNDDKRTAAQSQVHDEIADLLQLEKENSRLRRELGDKLRAENAELRRRLGLS